MLRGEEHAMEREDIVANALAQVVTGYSKKNPEARNVPPPVSDLEGMMKTIVRRRLLDHHRQHYRRTIVPLDETTLQATQDITPENHAIAAELWQTVAQLDPPLPDLFIDRFLFGWNTEEIAGRRGLNPNTVLSHFHRGYAKLRVMLTQGRRRRPLQNLSGPNGKSSPATLPSLSPPTRPPTPRGIS